MSIAQPGERQGFEVFCGVDVARATHHAVALDHGGRRLVDRPLPNNEAALRTSFSELTVHGQVLVVVDQPASIGALAIAVARHGNRSRLSSRAGDAPHRRSVSRRGQDRRTRRVRHRRRRPHIAAHAASGRPDEQAVAALGVLAGYDADLANEATRLTNRLHDALLHVHPAPARC
ncbi:transposase [Plantactinospora veratri]|uniref:Transposase n=1 Tax=Plantactinospora veratri TaxID=1436122 RepID=A0ABU7SJ03_9ACTN